MPKNRVSPNPPKGNNKAKKNQMTKDEKNEEETLRRRRRRSFDAGTEEYAVYIQKRVFNKREAWTAHLWERKR